jgi:hypothetical protein
MTLQGLKALHENEIPKRGNILVEFKEKQTDGVAGVIGSVITNITGSTTLMVLKDLQENMIEII